MGKSSLSSRESAHRAETRDNLMTFVSNVLGRVGLLVQKTSVNRKTGTKFAVFEMEHPDSTVGILHFDTEGRLVNVSTPRLKRAYHRGCQLYREEMKAAEKALKNGAGTLPSNAKRPTRCPSHARTHKRGNSR